VTYELINSVTTNSLASFASEQEAREAWERFAESDERFAKDLVIIAFDDEGLALLEDGAQELKPSAELVAKVRAEAQLN
jgi:hypothetical protein